MKQLFVFLFFIPYFGFGKGKEPGAVEGKTSALQKPSAPPGDNYIGTVQRVKDGKIIVRLRGDLEARKKKVQVAFKQLGTQNGGAVPSLEPKPVYVDLYDPSGVKRGRAMFSSVQSERSVIFEVVGGGAQETGVGWKIGLRNQSFNKTPQKRTAKEFGLGLFYELKWK